MTADTRLPGLRAGLANELLRVEQLDKVFRLAGRRGESDRLHAASEVTFDIARGETLGLVGESGCGKSTIARCILRLLEPTAGRVFFDGTELGALSGKELRRIRSRLQIVFQDPYSSLDPRMNVRDIVAEPLRVHGVRDARERADRVEEILDLVGISAAQALRRPHAFSGGQRQRIALARSLVLNPDFLVLDEPVTALDVSVQAQVLNVLMDLRERLDLTYLFIVHDLAVAEHFCHRVGVVYLGHVVELAGSGAIFAAPLHPYTNALLSAAPVPDPASASLRQRILLTGEVSPTHAAGVGCPFQARCPVGRDRDVCAVERPPLTERVPDHWVACHFPGELRFAGRDTEAASPTFNHGRLGLGEQRQLTSNGEPTGAR
jgi:oligopeptide/dipeptide ABC transporter ATP-binding protein